MTPIFAEAGVAQLDAFAQPGVLCIFDFDGTLSPIVALPDQAHLPAAVRERLLKLQALAPVAILTGRALTDIAVRLEFTPDFLIGNHGLEGLPGSGLQRDYFTTLCAGWRAVLLAAFADTLRFDPAIALEDKTISLSVHYRMAEDPARAEAALHAVFATLVPVPRVIAGKFVFNLLPQAAGDKGTAFEELMRLSGASRAIYVGDDVTDEDVFRLARPDLLSIRVGETAVSAASFFLRRYNDMLQLLDYLIDRLQPALTAPKRKELP